MLYSTRKSPRFAQEQRIARRSRSPSRGADDDRAECRTDDQTDARAFADSDACADEVH